MQKRRRRNGTQFGERVGHRGWLIGPKFFRPKAYPTCMSSKLCEFIEEEVYHFILKSILFDFLLAPLGALSAPKIKVACVMATLFSYGRDSFQMLRYHFCTSFLNWFLHILFLGINIKAVSIDNSNISFHSFRTWHQRELVRCGARVWDALLLWPFQSNRYDIKRILADVLITRNGITEE